MIYTFARVSAAVKMDVKDVFPKQENLWVRLHEKGGKYHEMPCQHNLKDWLPAILNANVSYCYLPTRQPLALSV
jgi:integrase